MVNEFLSREPQSPLVPAQAGIQSAPGRVHKKTVTRIGYCARDARLLAPRLRGGKRRLGNATMTLAIRPAVPGDAPLVFALVKALAGYEKLAHEVDASEAMIDAALFGAHPTVFADIAEWDGAPAGFALWFNNFSSFRGRHGIYLEDLFVKPEHRGKGIGKALLVHLARRCVKEGWPRFEWSVLNWNKPAIDFYESQGAELLREWSICRVSGAALERLGGR